MTDTTPPPNYIAFAGPRRIASGTLQEVTRAATQVQARRADADILVFEERSSRQVELDLRGDADAAVARLERDDAHAQRKPGRPRLGVVAREVTLLPRHWEWLNQQPGGASAVLRRLVEDARRGNGKREQARQSAESVYRFMHVMAGNRPGFEEALRFFDRGERSAFAARIAAWPKDVREHVQRLASIAWDDKAAAASKAV